VVHEAPLAIDLFARQDVLSMRFPVPTRPLLTLAAVLLFVRIKMVDGALVCQRARFGSLKAM
jgi:hypothetical protein